MRPALIFITVCAGFAQTAPSPLPFDAASVKPGNPGDLGGPTFQFNPGGGLNITNGTLRDIIETAYSVRDFQILGGPGWLNSARYDIYARSAPGNAPNGVAETRLKVQTLLSQRFQLKVHRETRDLERQLGCPVADRTGLSGKYNLQFDWTPDSGPCSGQADNGTPSIFTAIEEKLGLKLESTKGPVEVILVDHAEKPDEN